MKKVNIEMKRFKVVVPDLDFVVDEFDTRAEAENFIGEAIEWDKKHPQGYTPCYEIEEC